MSLFLLRDPRYDAAAAVDDPDVAWKYSNKNSHDDAKTASLVDRVRRAAPVCVDYNSPEVQIIFFFKRQYMEKTRTSMKDC